MSEQPVRSMTGFGRAEHASESGRFSVEMRSVNHRFLEVNLNLPPGLGAHEPELRQLFASRLRRGRVDVFVSWERPSAGRYRVSVDHKLLVDVRAALETVCREQSIPGQVDIQLLAGQAGAVSVTEVVEPIGQEAWRELAAVFEGALSGLETMRVEEGRTLALAIGESLAALEAALRRAEEAAKELPVRMHRRLMERVAELVGEAGVDAERLHQELALLADKMDVTEEIVRLGSHIERAREMLAAGGETGKRLDFLVQEMGREANTLGAKARGLDVAEPLVEMKSEIEKIREQARNLE